MDVLNIFLFGTVRIISPTRQSEVKVTRTSQMLLAFLLLQRHRPQPRDLLADLLWGEQSQERARSCLNTALWRLRRILEEAEVESVIYLLTNSLGDISFNIESNYWLDVANFEEQMYHILGQPVESLTVADTQLLQETLELYRGDLMEGFYDDWVLRERDRLRNLYVCGLTRLMQYFRFHGAFEKGITQALKILELEPLREEIHCELIGLYLKNGQRALAARQYEYCCQVLKQELDIQPSDETRRLYQKAIRAPITDEPSFRHIYSTALKSNKILQEMLLFYDAGEYSSTSNTTGIVATIATGYERIT